MADANRKKAAPVEVAAFDPVADADLVPVEDHRQLPERVAEVVPFVPASEVPSLPDLAEGDGNG